MYIVIIVVLCNLHQNKFVALLYNSHNLCARCNAKDSKFRKYNTESKLFQLSSNVLTDNKVAGFTNDSLEFTYFLNFPKFCDHDIHEGGQRVFGPPPDAAGCGLDHQFIFQALPEVSSYNWRLALQYHGSSYVARIHINSNNHYPHH